MSRREALGAAAISTSVALNSINALAAGDPGPALWRRWRKAAATWSEQQSRLDHVEIEKQGDPADIPRLTADADRLWAAFMAVEHETLEHRSPTKASIAAKMHVLLDHHAFDDLNDPVCLAVMSILTDLLPSLPEDMATNIAENLDKFTTETHGANPVRDRGA